MNNLCLLLSRSINADEIEATVEMKLVLEKQDTEENLKFSVII